VFFPLKNRPKTACQNAFPGKRRNANLSEFLFIDNQRLKIPTETLKIPLFLLRKTLSDAPNSTTFLAYFSR